MTTSRAYAAGRARTRRAADGRAVAAAARAGFTARGVIYVLVGVLALRIAFSGGGGQQADRSGAIAEIARQPFGKVLLWLLGIGLAGMALWRLSEALFGQAGPDGHKPGKRAMAGGRFVFYGVVAYSVLAYAAGTKSNSGSSDKSSRDVTSKVLGWPGGQWIVGVAGVGVALAGVWIAVRAVTRKFEKHLKMGQMSRRERRMVDFFGVFGGASRGVIFAAAGCFAIVAAKDRQPGKAKGMDNTLRSFAETPAGPWLLALVAVGLIAFGVFSWASARWRDV